MIAKGCSLRNPGDIASDGLDLPAAYEGEGTSLIPWRSVAFYEYVPSRKTQNEENRAVMGRELLWAVCGF